MRRQRMQERMYHRRFVIKSLRELVIRNKANTEKMKAPLVLDKGRHSSWYCRSC